MIFFRVPAVRFRGHQRSVVPPARTDHCQGIRQLLGHEPGRISSPTMGPGAGGGFVGSEVKDFFMQILDAWKSIPPRELINISKTFGNWEKTHLQTCLGWGVSWSGRELVIEPPPISNKIKWKTCLNPRHCTLKYLVQMQLYTSISISTSISIYLDKNDDLFRRDFGLAVGTSPVGLFVGFVVSWRLHGSTVHHLTPARSGMSKKPKQRFFFTAQDGEDASEKSVFPWQKA